jgi:hypothetical protein
MIQVSKNFKLGHPIFHLNEINELAKEAKSVAYRPYKFDHHPFKVMPAAVIQNWTIRTCSKFEFFKTERI